MQQPTIQTTMPTIPTTTTTTQTSSATANDTRITAPDFDQMLEQQKQKKQSSQQLNIDHGQLAKEIEAKGQRTLEFAPKASETALQKLKKGYDRAGPYVEYESKSYTRPDGSRVTKVISNKGTSCMRANRPHDRIDNRGPRVWKVECWVLSVLGGIKFLKYREIKYAKISSRRLALSAAKPNISLVKCAFISYVAYVAY